MPCARRGPAAARSRCAGRGAGRAGDAGGGAGAPHPAGRHAAGAVRRLARAGAAAAAGGRAAAAGGRHAHGGRDRARRCRPGHGRGRVRARLGETFAALCGVNRILLAATARDARDPAGRSSSSARRCGRTARPSPAMRERVDGRAAAGGRLPAPLYMPTGGVGRFRPGGGGGDGGAAARGRRAGGASWWRRPRATPSAPCGPARRCCGGARRGRGVCGHQRLPPAAVRGAAAAGRAARPALPAARAAGGGVAAAALVLAGCGRCRRCPWTRCCCWPCGWSTGCWRNVSVCNTTQLAAPHVSSHWRRGAAQDVPRP